MVYEDYLGLTINSSLQALRYTEIDDLTIVYNIGG
jgi:hypothetical protein